MTQPRAPICHTCGQDLPADMRPGSGNGHFVMIPLTQGKFALVDECDAEWIESFGKWYAAGRDRTYYAARGGSKSSQRIFMHWLIAGCKRPDHVNRNGLDNRRINLRAATGTQNIANQGLSRRNTSGYKGVSWHRPAGLWTVNIRVEGRVTHLGYFEDPVEGARAYNAAALEHFGEFAWLNPLPPESGDECKPKLRPRARENASGYRGVHWVKRTRKWAARIKIGDRRPHLGTFDNPVDAARAYNAAALEAWGESARLNVLPDAAEPPAA